MSYRRRGRPKKRSKYRYTLEEKRAYADKLRKRMTPAELKLWVELKRRQSRVGADFKAQEVVCGYIPDFVELSAGLIVEVDGPIHRHQKKRDAIRQKHLEASGYRLSPVSERRGSEECSVCGVLYL